MERINTLCGSVSKDDVSLICPHEHLILDMTHEAIRPQTPEDAKLLDSEITMELLGKLRRNPYIVRDNLRLNSAEDAISELQYLSASGCDLLVDLTSVGLGRDIRKLQKIANAVNIPIVVGCGLYVHDVIPEAYRTLTEQQIADWMISEIRQGIEGSGIRPGVIGEIGVSEKVYPEERRSLLGAAQASLETGLPIYVHTYPWSRAGLEAADLLLEAGVPARKICLCHLDVAFDFTYILQALERDIVVEFDNFSKEFYFEGQDGAFSGGPFETDTSRVRMLKKLHTMGFGKQLLLANDLCLKISYHKYGGWGYDHIFTNIIPMMRMEGFEENEIHELLWENPKNFLFQ